MPDARTMRNDRRLSVLFVVPRFHTNLFFATRALVDYGHKVSVIATSSMLIEDHSVVRPIVITG